MDICNLAKNDRYLNDSIKILINKPIIEYDMKDAGLSIIRKYKLLPDDEIKSLVELNEFSLPDNPKCGKKKANIKIGKMQIKNQVLKEGLKLGFMSARDSFITANDITENEVLSIKKDALFIMRHVDIEELDKYIIFRPKNEYTSYLLIEDDKGRNRIELYYKDNYIDIKGLGDEGEEHHKDYMLSFILKFFNKSQSSTKEEILKFIRIFIDKYKRLELEDEYYIEFKNGGKYQYKDGSTASINIKDKSELDISYNFNILIKLVLYTL